MTGQVSYIMRADRDGWAVLVDGQQVGVVLKHRVRRPMERAARTTWTFEGDPHSDNYATRKEATDWLLHVLALRERQAMAADAAAKRGDADPS